MFCTTKQYHLFKEAQDKKTIYTEAYNFHYGKKTHKLFIMVQYRRHGGWHLPDLWLEQNLEK